MAANVDSHGETSNGRPGSPPTASTSVPSSSAIATPLQRGIPDEDERAGGASTVSPPIVNGRPASHDDVQLLVAARAAAGSSCSSTTGLPAPSPCRR